MESSKTCPTNIELRLTQYNIIFKFPDHIPMHCLIHVLQYLLYILTSYAFHTAMWCANLIHITYKFTFEAIHIQAGLKNFWLGVVTVPGYVNYVCKLRLRWLLIQFIWKNTQHTCQVTTKSRINMNPVWFRLKIFICQRTQILKERASYWKRGSL